MSNKRTALLAGLSLLVILVVSLSFGYASKSKNDDNLPKHVIPYVDGSAAVDHVNNFFQSYLNPKNTSERDAVLVKSFGDKNLVFYSQYYRHGFDPIICSTVKPVSATATLVSTGPVAVVNVKAVYSDHTVQDIASTVVLNNDGMLIDSVVCPSDKANLLPSQ
jgi:hypothetical protein